MTSPPLRVLGSCILVLALVACSGASEADLVSSARALLDKKDPKGATIQLKSALQKNPDSAPARLLLGKTLLESGDPAAALVELRKAQELQAPDEQVVPELARAMLLVGEEARLIAQYADTELKQAVPAAELKTSLAAAYAVQGDAEKARQAVEQALRLKPAYAPALIVLARLRAGGGDTDGAIALLDQVLAADATNERAGVLKGELLVQARRDLDGGLTAFRQVLQAHPGSIAARAASVNILFQQKKTDEAKAQFALLKKAAPNHPETLYFEARLAFADKDYKRTRELSDQILKAMPDNVRVLQLAGAAEFRSKAYVQAEALLSRALKLAPQQLLTRQLLAQTQLRSGQSTKALEVLQPVLDGESPDSTTLALAGEAYLQAGDPKRSEAAFQRALKLAPQDNRVRTTAALAQLARGNNAAAVSELESIAGGDSGPRADLALVSARLRQNDMAGALKAIDGLEKKMPDQALPLQLRGRLLLMKRDIPAAVRSFDAALVKEPSYFPAVASLAAIELDGGKPEIARKRFEAYLQAQPRSWQAKMAIAELDARTGAPAAKVEATLREASRLDPSEPRPHLVLINNLINSGDAKGALQAAQDAIAALPGDVDVIEALGRAELAAGDHQHAISTFKKLAGLQPRSPMPEVRLAEAYLAVKDREAAADALRRALQMRPDLLAPRRTLAALALLDNRPQDAVAIAREVQRRNPKDAAGFVMEGEIEAGRKGWDAAIAAFRTALVIAPASDTSAKLHAALTAAGRSAEAEKLAAEWQKAHPRDVSFDYYLGDVALAQNDLARAEARYRKVLELQPEHALALNNVAWLMARQGKPGAVALAEKANALLPDRPPLIDTLAAALEAENQLPRAIETQKRAIALDPKNPGFGLRLAKLYLKSGDKARARAELEPLARLGEKFPAQAEVAALLNTL